MAKKKKPMLANVLFISAVDEGTDDSYYDVKSEPIEFAEMGITKAVGHYRLVEMLTVEAKPEVKKGK